MRVEIVKERRLQAVGATGPFVRVFAIGDVIDLPEMHARSMIASGHARVAGKPVPTPAKPVVDDAETFEVARPKRARKSSKE